MAFLKHKAAQGVLHQHLARTREDGKGGQTDNVNTIRNRLLASTESEVSRKDLHQISGVNPC
jgi:hypothetical protein